MLHGEVVAGRTGVGAERMAHSYIANANFSVIFTSRCLYADRSTSAGPGPYSLLVIYRGCPCWWPIFAPSVRPSIVRLRLSFAFVTEVESKVFPEPHGSIVRRRSPFHVALGQTPTEAARSWIRGLVHCVVCPFTPTFSLVPTPEGWRVELALVHSIATGGIRTRDFAIASPAPYHAATGAP